MPSVLAPERDLNRPVDQDASRRPAGNCDVGGEGVTAGTERLPGDDVDAQAPANGHVQVSWERCAARVRLDLNVVADHGHAIETQAADACQHGRAGPILEHGAQTVGLLSPASEVAQAPRSARRAGVARAAKREKKKKKGGAGGGSPPPPARETLNVVALTAGSKAV